MLSPGAVRAPGLLGIVPEDQQDGFAENMASMIPRGQLGDADDVAAAALLLASDNSKHVSGAEWFIDRGCTSVCREGCVTEPSDALNPRTGTAADRAEA